MSKLKPAAELQDVYLGVVADALEQVLASGSKRDPQQMARTAKRLIQAKKISKAADVLMGLARELEESLATTGYVLSAVLSNVASCKYRLDEPELALELQKTSDRLYGRVNRLRGAVADVLTPSSVPRRRSRPK